MENAVQYRDRVEAGRTCVCRSCMGEAWVFRRGPNAEDAVEVVSSLAKMACIAPIRLKSNFVLMECLGEFCNRHTQREDHISSSRISSGQTINNKMIKFHYKI